MEIVKPNAEKWKKLKLDESNSHTHIHTHEGAFEWRTDGRLRRRLLTLVRQTYNRLLSVTKLCRLHSRRNPTIVRRSYLWETHFLSFHFSHTNNKKTPSIECQQQRSASQLSLVRCVNAETFIDGNGNDRSARYPSNLFSLKVGGEIDASAQISV